MKENEHKTSCVFVVNFIQIRLLKLGFKVVWVDWDQANTSNASDEDRTESKLRCRIKVESEVKLI